MTRVMPAGADDGRTSRSADLVKGLLGQADGRQRAAVAAVAQLGGQRLRRARHGRRIPHQPAGWRPAFWAAAPHQREPQPVRGCRRKTKNAVTGPAGRGLPPEASLAHELDGVVVPHRRGGLPRRAGRPVFGFTGYAMPPFSSTTSRTAVMPSRSRTQGDAARGEVSLVLAGCGGRGPGR